MRFPIDEWDAMILTFRSVGSTRKNKQSSAHWEGETHAADVVETESKKRNIYPTIKLSSHCGGHQRTCIHQDQTLP